MSYPRLTKTQQKKADTVVELLFNPDDEMWNYIFITALGKVSNTITIKELFEGKIPTQPNIPKGMTQTFILLTRKQNLIIK